jgi:hypothetical protein
LDPTDNRIKLLLDNEFKINDLSDSISLISAAYQIPTPTITLANDSSVTFQPITDTNAMQNIDSQCKVKVANIVVDLAAATTQWSLTEQEGSQNATKLDSLFPSLNSY